jgi:hypothetical protein
LPIWLRWHRRSADPRPIPIGPMYSSSRSSRATTCDCRAAWTRPIWSSKSKKIGRAAGLGYTRGQEREHLMASVQELVPTHGLVAACRVLGLWRGAPARQQAVLRRADFVGRRTSGHPRCREAGHEGVGTGRCAVGAPTFSAPVGCSVVTPVSQTLPVDKY